MREQVIQAVLEGKIIAIVRGVDTDSVVKIAEALYEGGIRMVEVTFNQADPANFSKTADSIRAIREQSIPRENTSFCGYVSTTEAHGTTLNHRYTNSPCPCGQKSQLSKPISFIPLAARDVGERNCC